MSDGPLNNPPDLLEFYKLALAGRRIDDLTQDEAMELTWKAHRWKMDNWPLYRAWHEGKVDE